MTARALRPKDKREILDRLLEAWLSTPELRLGQLISNALQEDSLFYVEDNDFAKAVESFADAYSRKV